MSKIVMEVSTKDLLSKFASLSTKKQSKVYSQAARKALQPLVTQTKANLRKEFGSVANRKDKYGNSLTSGVKMKIYKDGSGGNVNILSNFKLKIFELGTKLRKTRKGYNRGKITAVNFFKNARQKLEKTILENIDSYIANSILKLWKK